MQYLYKKLIIFFGCLMIVGMSDAKKKSRHGKVTHKSEINAASVQPSIKEESKEKLHQSENSETVGESNTGPVCVETHQLKKVIPQDMYSTDATATKVRSIQIRVLLDELQNPSWEMKAEGGFWLLDARNYRRRISVDQDSVIISCKSGFVYINGKRLTRNEVVIQAKDGNIMYNGHEYQGSFYVVCTNSKTLLINCVDLEDYVACVIYKEAWPGWPHEMNKVLAIAIRSYGVAMMREAADKKSVYHVKNTVAHQVYAGVHENKALHDAVIQTQGIIMTYHNKPIIAMYDACCGGVVTARMKGIDFVKAPYLARKSACTNCRTCRVFDWKAEFDRNDLTALLKQYLPHSSKIKSIQISKKDGAGLVREVSVKTARGYTAIAGNKIYGLPKIKSYYYSIQNTPTKVIFKGRGYGHHVGLCQWGACKMVHDGLDYKRVLRFYYPGITFMKIVR